MDKVQSQKLKGDPLLGRSPQFCEYFLQECYQVLGVKIRTKSRLSSGRGRGKVAVLKYTRTFCSFNKAYVPSRETILPELK